MSGDKVDLHDGNARDLLEDFLATHAPKAEKVRRRKDFQPWHKPRKHYLRLHQWCSAVRELAAELESEGGDNREISYLGLPGDDMLDIRALHQVCESAGVDLRYLGFNDSLRADDFDSHISNNELVSKGYPRILSARSQVVPDSLESLAAEDTVARKKLIAHAPYDIVNIDLCDSIVKTPPGLIDSTVQALREIVFIQRARRRDPWLLFLTTRASRSQIDSEVWGKITGRVEQNRSSSSEFDAKLQSMIGNTGPLYSAFGSVGAGQRDSSQDEGLRKTLVVGFCKWLIGVSLKGSPKWEAHLHDVAAYKIHSGLDMYSFVFMMRPRVEPAIDETGWTSEPLFSQAGDGREVELAIDAIDKIRTVSDVDSLLRDKGTLDSVVEAAAALMTSARYNADEYREWVKKGCPKPRTRRRHKSQRRT